MQVALSSFALATSIALAVTVSGQTTPPIPDLEFLVARGLVASGPSASQALDGVCTPEWVSTFGPLGNPDVENPVRLATAFGSGAARRWIAVRVRANPSGARGEFVDARDGNGWTTLGEVTGVGSGPAVSMLQVLDDGSGERLYTGGSFTAIDGVPYNGIAVHYGRDWSALGIGVGGSALCAALFDAGQGPRLIVGGDFTSAGGVPVDHIARWNGSAWSNLGPGLVQFVFLGTVHDLALFDEGQGPRLFVLGSFDVPGCLGGAVGYFSRLGEVQNTDAVGAFGLTLDLTSLPTPTGAVPAVPGDTWHFQAWYRDRTLLGATSNFTPGVSVEFD